MRKASVRKEKSATELDDEAGAGARKQDRTDGNTETNPDMSP